MRRPLAALALATTLALLGAGACSSEDTDTSASATTDAADGVESTIDAGTASGSDDTDGPTDTDRPADDGEPVDDGATASGGTADPAAAPYVDAMVEGMVDDETFPATEVEARCIAESVVGAIGVDALEAQGLTPEQFGDAGDEVFQDTVGPEQADAIGAAMVDCFEDPIATFAEAFAEGSPPDVRDCLEQELDEEELKVFFTQMLLVSGEEMVDPPPEVLRMVLGLAQACPGLL